LAQQAMMGIRSIYPNASASLPGLETIVGFSSPAPGSALSTNDQRLTVLFGYMYRSARRRAMIEAEPLADPSFDQPDAIAEAGLFAAYLAKEFQWPLVGLRRGWALLI
jgi:hypothetical protein